MTHKDFLGSKKKRLRSMSSHHFSPLFVALLLSKKEKTRERGAKKQHYKIYVFVPKIRVFLYYKKASSGNNLRY